MAIPLPHAPQEQPPGSPQRVPSSRLSAPSSKAPPPKRVTRIIAFAIAIVIWSVPPPGTLTAQAWHLFAIFAATILAVVIGAFPILTASVIGIAAAVFSGTLVARDAYAGFSNPTIVLTMVAFLVARAGAKSGLGVRLGYHAVSWFGRSSLGLAYSIFAVDAVIAPAFLSTTARSGVLYQLVSSLAKEAGAAHDGEDRRRFGRFLIFSGMASLTLSSALWLTAMAGNPLGAEIAARSGVRIGFASWLVASSGPTIIAMILAPFLLYKLVKPEATALPNAPAEARAKLAALGPLTRDQKIVGCTFLGMVVLWAMARTLGLDSTAIAFLALGVLLGTGVLAASDISKEGDVLATFIWFALLFTMSDQLNRLGFVDFVGARLVVHFGGLPVPIVAVILVVAYVALHYLFVSQVAHLLALFAVFLSVGMKLGVSGSLLAHQLLCATSYSAVITPQGSDANQLFVSSGYLTQRELYKMGALYTAFCTALYLIIGTPWLMVLAR